MKCLLLAAIAIFSVQATAAEPPERSILFIGNSMIGKTMQHLQLLTKANGKPWKITVGTKGGARLEKFKGNPEHDALGTIDKGGFTDVVFVQGTRYWFEGNILAGSPFPRRRNMLAKVWWLGYARGMTRTEQVPYTAQSRSKPNIDTESAAPALDRGLAVLEALDARPDGMTLTEISVAIGGPKNSTSRLIQTLIARDYVLREDATMRFRLTSRLLRMGQPRIHEMSLVECALETMRALRDAVGETVQLGIPIGDEGVIVEKIESTRAVRIGVNLGLRFPLHNNAPGKVLLASQNTNERERTIRRIKLMRSTARTITDKESLRIECERVLKQGYATDWGEADEGIHCVAAPIRDRLNLTVATIWVSGVAGRMPKSVFAEVAAETVQAASKIKKRLQG